MKDENHEELDAEDILDLLPGGNCGLCGEADCWVFALGVASGKYTMDDCPSLKESKKKE